MRGAIGTYAMSRRHKTAAFFVVSSFKTALYTFDRLPSTIITKSNVALKYQDAPCMYIESKMTVKNLMM